METVSLSEALKGRMDIPSIATAARWIRRGWVSAKGGGGRGAEYEVDSEVLYQLRVLYKLAPYFNASVLGQVGHILQNRHNDPHFIGWLGVLENGKLVNVPWDTQPIKDVVVGGLRVEAVINLHRMPADEATEEIQKGIPMVTGTIKI